MNFRQLGRSGLKVSEISLGGWLTHGRTVSESETSAIVHRAFDLGINLFDTADVYHTGAAELALGKAIQDLRREDLVIATKCFWPMSENVNDRGLSRKHITESVHASLKRMQIDYIDLFQFHRFDPETPVEESVQAIDDLIKQGKVLYWGVSCWSGPQISEGVQLAEKNLARRPISNQPPYHMLNAGIEVEVIPTSAELGLSQIVFSPLCQGVLTGKYLPGQPPPANSRGGDSNSNQFMTEVLKDETLIRVQNLKQFAESNGVSLTQFALRWCLRQPNVASVIVGASTIAQIEANASATDAQIESAILEEGYKILHSQPGIQD